MGQYYNVYTKKGSDVKVFDRHVMRDEKKKYTGAKLLEHSWWTNDFVSSFSYWLYEYGPMQVAWVGDYADEFPDYERVWGNDYGEPVCEAPMEIVDFTLDRRYIINHTKNEFVDCDDYKACSTIDSYGSCIHPIPLLTCIGNGRGGGDYHNGTCMDFVGRWCNDIISIEDVAPKGMQKIQLNFIEEV